MAAAETCAAARFTSERWLLLLPVGYFSAVHSVIFGAARFHFVIVPILAVLAANAWAERWPVMARLWLKWDADSRLKRCRFAFAVICAAFLAMWVWGQLQVAERWQLVFEPGGHQANLPF